MVIRNGITWLLLESITWQKYMGITWRALLEGIFMWPLYEGITCGYSNLAWSGMKWCHVDTSLLVQ